MCAATVLPNKEVIVKSSRRGLAFFLSLLSFALGVSAPSCAQSGTAGKLTLLGQWGGTCRAVAVSLASPGLVLCGKGMQVVFLDIGNPGKPVYLSESSILGGIVEDILIQGRYAYVAADDGGIVVFDLNDRNHPVVVATLDFEYGCTGMVRYGNYLYCKSFSSAFVVVDISRPASPVKKKTVQFPDSYDNENTVDLAVAGEYLYIAGTGNWVVYSLAQPDDPRVSARVAYPKEAGEANVTGLSATENLLCMAEFSLGLLVFSIKNPTRPQFVAAAQEEAEAYASRLSMNGNQAILSNTIYGTKAYDLSNPAKPKLLYSLPARGQSLYAMVANDLLVVAADAGGMELYGLKAGASPVFAGGYNDHSHSARKVTVSGKLAYVSDESAGVQIVDCSDPARMRRKGQFQQEGCGCAFDLEIRNDIAYVAYGSEGLRVLDMKDPSRPLELSPMGSGLFYDVLLDGNFAWVADAGRGLYRFDVTDPSAPREVWRDESLGGLWSVSRSGNLLFLGVGDEGISILDVSDPLHPVKLGSAPKNGWNAFAATASGKYAYVADADAGFTVLDVGNPGKPAQKANLHFENAYIMDVVLQGTTAYLADSYGGIRIVDISNPLKPRSVGFVEVGSGVEGIAVQGTLLLAAAKEGGLIAYRIR